MHLRNFEVKRTLGVGAFGSVKLVKAHDKTFDKDATNGYYALKCISKELVEESGLTSHVLNEKAVMSQLDHPFIVRFVSAIQDSQNIYFLLESLLGESFAICFILCRSFLSHGPNSTRPLLSLPSVICILER